MIRTLPAEAVIIAKRMIQTYLTEAVVIRLRAKMVIWRPIAERRGGQSKTSSMAWMRATESSLAKALQGFGAAPGMIQKRRRDGGDRGRGRDDLCGRSRRGASERTEREAVHQRAVNRTKSCHGSASG